MIMTFNCIHGMETVIGLVQLRQLGPNARGRVSTERITAKRIQYGYCEKHYCRRYTHMQKCQ